MEATISWYMFIGFVTGITSLITYAKEIYRHCTERPSPVLTPLSIFLVTLVVGMFLYTFFWPVAAVKTLMRKYDNYRARKELKRLQTQVLRFQEYIDRMAEQDVEVHALRAETERLYSITETLDGLLDD
jgi:hypothetical protein